MRLHDAQLDAGVLADRRVRVRHRRRASHTAIVSREYRIPAVCGTGLATTIIHTGDLVEVDGDAGVVRILERAG